MILCDTAKMILKVWMSCMQKYDKQPVQDRVVCLCVRGPDLRPRLRKNGKTAVLFFKKG